MKMFAGGSEEDHDVVSWSSAVGCTQAEAASSESGPRCAKDVMLSGPESGGTLMSHTGWFKNVGKVL